MSSPKRIATVETSLRLSEIRLARTGDGRVRPPNTPAPVAAPTPAVPVAENKTRDDFLIVGKLYTFYISNPGLGLPGKVLSKPTDGWVKIEMFIGGKTTNAICLVNLNLCLGIVEPNTPPLLD